ncbi:MAG: Cys-tRNA(Pro) deacylase [Melioribacteraceae bacterium]|nr:Cys-tRNA(Pro) deacylase [Melioribacteraceae bacterium]
MKTNAIRILESQNISHSLIEYEVDEEKLDAVSVALKIGFEPERVFKTLVARTDKNEIVVFVIPGNYELNLKKAASISESKKVEMIKVTEIQPLTGYIRGGCSPIGMKKHYKTFIDATAQLFDTISVSAGSKGIQMIISPADLLSVICGKYADLL